MRMRLVAGSGNLPLAQAVSASLGEPLARAEVEKFPDGEQHVQLLDSVRGADVFIVQPAGPPVDTHVIELLLLVDAARRAGAERITALTPYFGYARQDRRARGREALAARLIADIITTAGASRVVAVDLHSRALEGFFSVPLVHLSAVPSLIAELRQAGLSRKSVIVAPDLGAVDLAERFARALDFPVALVRKVRLTGSEVAVTGVSGDVSGRDPLIVDDMVSTGSTIIAAAESLVQAGARARVTVAATHGLFVGDAWGRLQGLGLDRLIVTDSLPQVERGGLQVVSIAPLLAEAIRRLHQGESLSGLMSAE